MDSVHNDGTTDVTDATDTEKVAEATKTTDTTETAANHLKELEELEELNDLADNQESTSDAGQVPFDINRLPASFKAFLDANQIDPQIYTVTDLPRYIRWNTHVDASKLPTLAMLQAQLRTSSVWAVPGCHGMFGFTHSPVRLMDIAAYKQQHVFGIDLSSAVAVDALEIQPDEQVLDLCCAPGAKLCMIANQLGLDGTGTVTGVDLAPHRLRTCRALLKKYSVGQRVRLFEADGTTFSVPPPQRLGPHVLDRSEEQPAKRQKRQPAVKPFWAPKTLRSDPQQSLALYNKVLVDAECTHDGSISHILKYEKWGWDTFERNFMDPHRLDTVAELQRKLMQQGWKMLQTGGIMVYSTCSLTIQQNEQNVAWFLEHHPDAKLESIPHVARLDIRLAPIKRVVSNDTISPEVEQAIHTHCIRFDPVISRTSGFFVARFRKNKT